MGHMTDRDTFAAAALTGLLADDGDRIDHAMSEFTRRAYEWADAMLIERGGVAYEPPKPTLTNEEWAAVEAILSDPDLVLGDTREPLRCLLERLSHHPPRENDHIPDSGKMVPTLTNEERAAIAWFSQLAYGEGGRVPDYAATLRRLLERMA